MSNGDLVLVEKADGVATLTLNRPDRMNAWTYELEAQFFDAVDDADDDPSVRAVLVTGAGRGFCPGMDASVLVESSAVGGPGKARERPMTHLASCRKLTVAAVNGACAGIGLVHALCCDVRFVASGAKLATSFVRRGLAPEFASGWLLTRIVGAGHAADLMLSARTIDGAEAASIGLAHRAVALEELMDVALEYARDVATNCSPRALAYAKQDLLADWTRSRADADRDSALIYSRPGHSEDLKEGVTSYVEKRPPRFEPLPPRAS